MTIKKDNTSKKSSQRKVIDLPDRLDNSFLSEIFESLTCQTVAIYSLGSLIGNSDFIDSHVRAGVAQIILLWVDEQNRILDLIHKRL